MSQRFHSFADIQRHLDSLGLFHMDMRLGRMEDALLKLNLSRPPFVVAQVLGTNGKGSTSTFLASLAQAHGCRVGLYTSPHFVSPTERIRINGQPVPGEEWVDAANRIMAVAPALTYFEFLTVLAVCIFADKKVDVAVLEAGLGGRYDATTAMPCDCCCFVPVAMDHADILGPTIADIAADKAHAIRSAAPVFTGPQFPIVAKILRERAQSYGAPLVEANPLPDGRCAGHPDRQQGRADVAPYTLGLAGAHQHANAALALECWRFLAQKLGRAVTDDAVRRGLAEAFVPGRLQRIAATDSLPPLILDGAHNPHGTRSLMEYLAAADIRPSACVYSCLHDKEWRPSLAMLARVLGQAPLFVPAIDNPRAEDPAAVVAFYEALHKGQGGSAHACTGADGNNDGRNGDRAGACGASPVAQALRMAATRYIPDGGPILVCGSLYLLAELFALHPQFLQRTSEA